MVRVGGRQVELHEDVGDVLFHRALGHPDRRGDGRVGAPLGHERQDLPFPGGEPGELIAVPAPAEELGDHLGVESGPAGGHPVQRVDEIVQPDDAFLEEIAEVKIRLSRQSVLDQENELVYVLSESALQRTVGGSTTMSEQLDHLVELSNRPNVTIQVLPFSAQTYTVASYSFVILRFDQDITSDVVYAESFTAADYLDSPAAIASYTALWDDLRAAALGPVESRHLITHLAEQYGESSDEHPRPVARRMAQEHP